jgi:penicillin-binding protein 1A
MSQQLAELQGITAAEWSGARLANKGAEVPPPFALFWRQHAALLAEMPRDTPAFRSARRAGVGEAQALASALADTASMDRLRDEKTRLTAGFVAIDPTSGAVRAWVGSPDFAREQFDHVVQAKRQPGSTFKPFVYGAALQRGFSTEQTCVDGEVGIALADGSVWHPTDGAGASGLPTTLREGLVQSKNTITAQVMQAVGAEAVVNFARAAGVRESTLNPVPWLALGTSPVTLLETADAYETLAALGERPKPLLIAQIADRDGRVLESFDSQPERVLDQPLIEKLVDVMRGVVQTGTGTAVRTEVGVRGDLAGKTGTTQNNTDGWFMLMSPRLVAGAWVGFNDARVTMRGNYWGQGGHNALRLVGSFFQQGQRAGLIDTQAEFPQVVLDAPMAAEAAPESAAAGEAPAGPASAPPSSPAEGTLPSFDAVSDGKSLDRACEG